MQTKLLEVLACPKCLGPLACDASEFAASGDVLRGTLHCQHCDLTFPIESGIPRFVPRTNYADSFGYQWNRFRKEQLDSFNGTALSEKRFYSETSWTSEELAGKWVLDAGCGAGRFLDIGSKTECQIVGMDISNAVDAAQASLKKRKNVHLVQASIYEPPFRLGSFDACYCIGVIQHTPDPPAALRSLPGVLRDGGRIAVTVYERRRWTPLYSKYLLRRFTRRVNDRVLLAALRLSMPILFPLTEVLFRIPVAGPYFAFAIPVANYVHEKESTWRQRYQLALLDTFDMLAPEYDQPQTQPEVVEALSAKGIEGIVRLPNAGLNLVGVKSASTVIAVAPS